MDLFDWEAFGATPLSRDPYEHVVVNGFVKRRGVAGNKRRLPRDSGRGKFPAGGTRVRPRIQAHGRGARIRGVSQGF